MENSNDGGPKVISQTGMEHPAELSFYMDHGPKPKRPTQSNQMRHAFIVVGTETIFLCHQIMSHMEGHNYEVVLEVTLPEDAKRTLMSDRLKNGATHFLANNQEQTLASMKAGHISAFDADIWNAFPKYPDLYPPWGDDKNPPIRPLLSGVHVKINRVVHYCHVNENMLGREYEEYFLFGKSNEAHVYHSIVRQPDYDHVATLKSAPEWLTADQLQAGVSISVPRLPWKPDTTQCGNPLPDDSTHVVLYFGITEYRDVKGGNPQTVPEYTMDVEKTWWYSTRVVNYFVDPGPCTPKQGGGPPEIP